MKDTNKHIILAIFIIVSAFVTSLVLHWNIFNKDICGIHSWRQSQTQLNVRYFYREDANILNTRVAHFNGGKDNLYRYEFPVLQWSLAMLQKLFGEHILVSRIGVFVVGLFTLTALGLLVYRLFNSFLVASLSIWSLTYSPVFFYYTVNPLPDNLALCSGMFYLYFAIRNYNDDKFLNHLLAAVFLLLATLSKLPFLVFGIVSVVFFIQTLSREKSSIKSLIVKALIYPLILAPAFFWYSWVMPGWAGNGILHGIFANDNSWANIQRILYYHVNTMFPKILMNPVSIILLISALIYFLIHKDFNKKKSIALFCGTFMVLIYFILQINMIDTVHDYYMMPFLPFIYIALAYGSNKLLNSNKYVAFLTVPVFLMMPFQNYLQNKDSWSVEKSGSNSNLFLHQELLKHAVPKGERVIVLNDNSQFVFFYKLDKEGYVFRDNYLPVEWVDDLVQNYNVRYMYSDSRIVDESVEMNKRIEKIILQVDDLKVIRLKSQKK